MNQTIAIITGASSGIGMEFAIQIDALAKKVDEIWLVARRKERMTELSKVLKTKTRIVPMDVTDAFAMEGFERLLEIEKPRIRMLINCAGFGLMGNVMDIPIDKQLSMVDVNIKALIKMTYVCIPYMKKNARILQLASSAAFLPQQKFAVYAASKSFVLSFSRALALELKPKKIYVTAVCPGPVDTEFFDRAGEYGQTLALKEKTMVTPDAVVKQALFDAARKKHMSVCSPVMKGFALMTKIVPHNVIFFFMRFLK